MGVGRFCRKMGGNGFFSRKMGESGSLLSKNGWEWVAFFEKWVRVRCFSGKMGGSRSFLSKNGWDWVGVFFEKCVRVGESGWERNSVKPN